MDISLTSNINTGIEKCDPIKKKLIIYMQLI